MPHGPEERYSDTVDDRDFLEDQHSTASSNRYIVYRILPTAQMKSSVVVKCNILCMFECFRNNKLRYKVDKASTRQNLYLTCHRK